MRAFLLLFLVGCTHDIEAYRPSDVKAARDLDVLFVLDDSADRANYAAMESQLDVLQTRLAETDGQLPNLHVGVVTTDLGVSGTLDAIPGPSVNGCVGTGKGGKLQRFASSASADYLEDLRGPAGARMRNYSSDDLTLELGELTNPAAAGAGCEYEQPLEAMRRALDPATNPGFIRPDAMLAIVFLTNEDDCSLARGAMLDPSDATLGPTHFRCTAQGVICDPDVPGSDGKKFNCRPREGSQFMVDVSEYEAFLAGYKPDRKDISVAAVAGPRSKFIVRTIGGPVLQPSCQGPGGSAVPAVRIGALVDSFGGAMIDSCTQDNAYQQIATPIVERQRTCFPSIVTTATEPDCTVVEVAGSTENELARCATGDAGPCWYSYTDAAACPSGGNIGVAIKRGTTTAPEGSRLEARCFIR